MSSKRNTLWTLTKKSFVKFLFKSEMNFHPLFCHHFFTWNQFWQIQSLTIIKIEWPFSGLYLPLIALDFKEKFVKMSSTIFFLLDFTKKSWNCVAQLFMSLNSRKNYVCTQFWQKDVHLKAQCGNFWIILPFRLWAKSILKDSKSSKSAILYFHRLWIFFFFS